MAQRPLQAKISGTEVRVALVEALSAPPRGLVALIERSCELGGLAALHAAAGRFLKSLIPV